MVTINRKVWLLRICGSSGFVSVSRTAANSLSMSPRSFLNCKNSSVLSTEAVHELWVAPPQCSDFTSDRIKRQLKWTFMQRSRRLRSCLVYPADGASPSLTLPRNVVWFVMLMRVYSCAMRIEIFWPARRGLTPAV